MSDKQYSQLTKDLVTDYNLNDATLGDLVRTMFSRIKYNTATQEDFVEAVFEMLLPLVTDDSFEEGYEACALDNGLATAPSDDCDDCDDCSSCGCGGASTSASNKKPTLN